MTGPYFKFMEGNDGSKATVCKVKPLTASRMSMKSMLTKWNCANDKARSMVLCYAFKGTKITVYGDPEIRREKDAYAEITVLEDMNDKNGKEGCLTIPTFEKSQIINIIDGINLVIPTIKVNYPKIGNLDGKVSSFVMSVP